jgi:predicted transcriptional regulator YdeE
MALGEVMKVVQVKSKSVSGLSVRTKNANEMNSSTAKIGGLWGQFYSSIATGLRDGAIVYGIYYDYETDFSGEFTVLAGTDLIEKSTEQELAHVSIAEGEYLVFPGTGKMPQVVIDVWAEIWNYFSAADCPHVRAYTTDFELYKNQNEVEIYIALK